VNAANGNGNAQQALVVNDLLTYMSNYNYWAYTDNFSKSSGAYKFLAGNNGFEKTTMMSDIQGLYQFNAGGGQNYYPTNPFPMNCTNQ
jgi:hypothetical protein